MATAPTAGAAPPGAAPAAPRVNWMREFLASIVVFLVALPLCLGIAIASGVPPALGLITGIVGGIIVGVIAGAPLQVSGPAAGLVVLTYDLVQQWGFSGLGLAVLLAGFIQLAAAAFKLGRIFRATAPPVIHGMLAGIGALILLSQLHVMIDDAPRSGGLANLLALPEAFGKVIATSETPGHRFAAMVGIVSLVVLIAWNRFRPEKLKAIPAALLAVVAGTVMVSLTQFDISRIAVPDNLIAGIQILGFADGAGIGRIGELLSDGAFLMAAVTLAVIASAESLLCAAAVDELHDGPRSKLDRELMAQGVGNTICGILCALPMTGVIVRSSANVDAGAKTRWSAVMHGFWLLILVLLFAKFLAVVPTTALAAVLVYTGWRLLNIDHVRHMWHANRFDAIVFLTTALIIVTADLLAGVVIGLMLSAGRLLLMFARVEVRTRQKDGIIDVHFAGAATFLSLPQLADALDSLPYGQNVRIHLQELAFTDNAALEFLDKWSERYVAGGGTVKMKRDYLAELARSKVVFMDSRAPTSDFPTVVAAGMADGVTPTGVTPTGVTPADPATTAASTAAGPGVDGETAPADADDRTR